MRTIVAGLFLFTTLSAVSQTRGQVNINGRVIDTAGRAIEFATISVEESTIRVTTDSAGLFILTLEGKNQSGVTLRVGFIGKQPVTRFMPRPDFNIFQQFVLKDNSLSLKEVELTSKRETGASNSSIIFDRSAIDQLQAFSLTDILNNLPGKAYAAPDLQRPKSITLRTEASGSAASNNSLGTAIIIDGIAQSNNANMQNKNIGNYGLGGSQINDSKSGISFDVPFSGIDLREIPADNIESIEVVSGVASARYGDLTDGAVLITRQAGRNAYQANMRVNGGSTNFSLSKGYSLGRKAGALNLNINYLVSNDDPRDRQKSYTRLGGGTMWTRSFGKHIKNTLSVDYSEKFDDVKQDPDDGRELLTWSKSRRVSISERFNAVLQNNVLKRISLSLGYDSGFQETYSQWYLNGNPRPMADKDTTGIYEGYYIPGNYYAAEHIKGKPVNTSGNLSLFTDFATGGVSHYITLGSSLSLSANNGAGFLADPQRPRFPNIGSKNDRPYNFDLVPNLVNTGLFVEDRMAVPVGKKRLNIDAGLRYDDQNGYGTLQPRINSRLGFAQGLSLNIAYGISTKAPTMAYRHPGPTYFDIPLINAYTGDARESLFLVYTYKYMPDNSQLKPSRSNQAEIGLSLTKKAFNSSVYAYYKRNTNGFNSQTSYEIFRLPTYNYTYRAGQRPLFSATGQFQNKASLSKSIVTNNVDSKTYGAEWLLSVNRINSLQTSFQVSTSFGFSEYRNSGNRIVPAADQYVLAGRTAWYGVYPAINYRNWSLSSKISTDTHIPKLGFIVSLYSDVFLLKNARTLNPETYPTAYIDKNYSLVEISSFDPADTDYGYLVKTAAAGSQSKLPFIYANLSMRIAKEIKKNLRFSFNAYNLLNAQPKYYNPETGSATTYNDPLSVGAGISLKF